MSLDSPTRCAHFCGGVVLPPAAPLPCLCTAVYMRVVFAIGYIFPHQVVNELRKQPPNPRHTPGVGKDRPDSAKFLTKRANWHKFCGLYCAKLREIKGCKIGTLGLNRRKEETESEKNAREP